MSREVPGEWASTTLGELTQISGGTTPSREVGEFWEEGQHFWATPTDITALPPGKVELTSTKTMVSDAALQKTSLKMLPVGSVLMTSRATIGYPAINTVPVATNQGFANFHPSAKYDAAFLAYWIVFSRKSLERSAGGSTFPEISKAALKSIAINLPPFQEQRRIAEILSSVDEAIAATRAVIEQTRKVKQGVLERLLTKGISHTRFKQTEIGEIPEGWEVDRIGNIGEVMVGRQRSPSFTDGVDFPYLRVANVFDNHIDTSDVLEMKFTDAELKRYLLKAGDILLNEGQSLHLVGRNARYLGDPSTYCFQNTLIRFRARESTDLDFAFALMQFLFSKGSFSEIATQTTSVAHLGSSRFAAVLVPVPSLEEQQEIGRLHNGFLETEARQKSQLDRLQLTKSALMSDLLTGRKRVADALPLAAE